jgi:molecular chaperone DnaK
LIKIPIVEGENDLADRNRHIDDLQIDATNIRRDLPANTEVEVTLKMDESRIITVTAYVPILDEEFSKQIELRKKTADAAAFLKNDFDAELARFNEAKLKAANTGAQTALDLAEDVEDSPLLEEVKGLLPSIAADVDVASKFEKRLLELKLKLDATADALEWPALKNEAKEWTGYLMRAAEKQGTQQQLQRTREISAQVEDAIKEQKADRLRKRIEQTTRLYYEIVMSQPGWWVYQFQQIEKKQDEMVDEIRATELLDRGRDCISRNNTTGLQTVVRQLWDLLPDDVVEAAKRGYQSGVIR